MKVHGQNYKSDVHPNPGPTNHNKDIPISICHANARSIVADLNTNYLRLGNRPPKVLDFEAFCNINDINILAITESWCNGSHPDTLIGINGLQKIFRRDRDDRTGGGVLVYASNEINITRLEDIEPPDSEIMCLEFQIPNRPNKFAFLCVAYRPQDKNIIDFSSDLQDVYEYTSGKGYYNFLCIGDFNAKNSEFCHTDTNSLEGRIFKAVLDSNGLSQLVHFPTRFDVANNRESCLDLIITNESSFVNNINSYGPIANCDHIPISFQINSKIPVTKNFTRHVWNFKRGDFEN